ncbi:hypothetical protein N7530_002853 [Penicillium desertorum]|uniref:Uncharacterized protein n=1 Tax=Penicillium desertorum TaxID=1303715 RepID=A0A9X0BTH0_9EURO|nr:hypothetical protein N7530_002853 [Penicillium desertorum]
MDRNQLLLPVFPKISTTLRSTKTPSVTGGSISYSGDSEDCYNGLGNGGAGLQLLALEKGGELVFYGQPGCLDSEQVASFIHANQTGLGCKPLSVNPVPFKFLDA